jgi:hypothetical protein
MISCEGRVGQKLRSTLGFIFYHLWQEAGQIARSKEEGINESSIIYDATIVVMREDFGCRREKTFAIWLIIRLQHVV